jgi:hypothetical protein
MAMVKHPCVDNCPIQMPILAMFDYWRVSLQDREEKIKHFQGLISFCCSCDNLWPSGFSGLLQFRLRQLQTSQSHRSYLGSRRVSEVFESTLKAWTCVRLYLSLHWRCCPRWFMCFFTGNCDEFLFVLFHLYHKLSTIICARYICIAKHVYLFVVVDL